MTNNKDPRAPDWEDADLIHELEVIDSDEDAVMVGKDPDFMESILKWKPKTLSNAQRKWACDILERNGSFE